jgi:hypothetical protein
VAVIALFRKNRMLFLLLNIRFLFLAVVASKGIDSAGHINLTDEQNTNIPLLLVGANLIFQFEMPYFADNAPFMLYNYDYWIADNDFA